MRKIRVGLAAAVAKENNSLPVFVCQLCLRKCFFGCRFWVSLQEIDFVNFNNFMKTSKKFYGNNFHWNIQYCGERQQVQVYVTHTHTHAYTQASAHAYIWCRVKFLSKLCVQMPLCPIMCVWVCMHACWCESACVLGSFPQKYAVENILN